MEQELYESSGSADERSKSRKKVVEINSTETNEACLEIEVRSSREDAHQVTTERGQLPVEDNLIPSNEEPTRIGMDLIDNSATTIGLDTPHCQNTAATERIANSQPSAPHGYTEETGCHPCYQDGLYPASGQPHPNMHWPASVPSYLPRTLFDASNIERYSMERNNVDNQQCHQHPGPMHIPQDRYQHLFQLYPPHPGYIQSPGYPHPHYSLPGYNEGRFRPPIPPGHPPSPAHSNQSSQRLNGIEEHWQMNRGQQAGPPLQHTSHHLQNYNSSATAQATYYRDHPRTQSPVNRAEFQDTQLITSSDDDNTQHSQIGPIRTTRQRGARQNPSPNSEKKYVCEECGMRFQRPSNLKVHILKHTGERPFTCDVCLKSFTTASNTTRHRKSLHRELYPPSRPGSSTGSPPVTDLENRMNTQSTQGSAVGGIEMQMARERMGGQNLERAYPRQHSERDRSQHNVTQGRSVNQSRTSAGNATIDSSPEYKADDDEEDADYEDPRERRLRRRTSRRE
jgi:Zinc finger, C2H2 type